MSVESRKEATKLWRKNNPERYKATKAKHQKKSQKEKWTLDRHLKTLLRVDNGMDRASITLEDLKELWDIQERRCALSGVPMTYIHGSGRVMTNISLDRKVPGGPYVKENVQLVCYITNVMKHSLSSEQLLWWCTKIVEKNL